MSKLSLSRIGRCKHPGCNQLGIAKDKKCIRHTSVRDNSRVSFHADYPTPSTEGVTGPAIGVEIECYPALGRTAALPHVEYWTTDCSLANDGREIKICNNPQKAQKMAAEIVRAIKLSGGIVDRGCGLHVHMSKPLHREIPDVYLRRNTYHVITDFMVALESSIWPLFQDRSRAYVSSWLVNKGNTMENRTHPATLNPHIMIAWIDVCVTIQKAINGYLTNTSPKKYEKWVNSGDIMYGIHKSSYAYRYLKARKDNGGRMSDEEFSLV